MDGGAPRNSLSVSRQPIVVPQEGGPEVTLSLRLAGRVVREESDVVLFKMGVRVNGAVRAVLDGQVEVRHAHELKVVPGGLERIPQPIINHSIPGNLTPEQRGYVIGWALDQIPSA